MLRAERLAPTPGDRQSILHGFALTWGLDVTELELLTSAALVSKGERSIQAGNLSLGKEFPMPPAGLAASRNDRIASFQISKG